MAGLSEEEKATLARQLQAEFEKTMAPTEPQSIQRYSESTKTLYSDEETAKRMIQSAKPLFQKQEKKEMTTDEMLKLLENQFKQEEKKPVRRGYAKIEQSEGKWHS